MAIQSSMIINSIEFYLYNNSEYINSGSSSTSYLKSSIPFSIVLLEDLAELFTYIRVYDSERISLFRNY